MAPTSPRLFLILATILVVVLVPIPAFEHQLEVSPRASLTRLQTAKFASEMVRNYNYATAPSIQAIIVENSALKPPLYPIFLYVSNAFGIDDFRYANLALMIVLLGLLGFVAFRVFPPLEAMVATLSVAVFAPMYEHLVFLRSEPLFVVLTVLTFLATVRYCQSSSWTRLLLLAVCLGAACFTRYIGALWLLPISVLCVLLLHRDNLLVAIARNIVLTAIALLPTVVFVLGAQWRGSANSMDRFARLHMEDLSWIKSLMTTVVELVTVVVDDFTTLATNRYAGNVADQWFEYIVGRYAGNVVDQWREYIVGMPVFLACAILMCVGIYWTVANLLQARKIEKTDIEKEIYWRLATLYLLFYIMVVLLVWPISSNDVLSTRFLLPIYPFGLFLMVRGYRYLTQTGTWLSPCAQVSIAGFFAIQLFKLAGP
ncbi:MAG: glycosyltransferase family 39 protein [Gammaproteobacteria bacterium]|nr:glycosyltransferase family 39 protein [Gammaproteobacteria bacterium]